jgi:hypothetical protein
MSREAKLEAISVAFAMFSRIYLRPGEVAMQAKRRLRGRRGRRRRR